MQENNVVEITEGKLTLIYSLNLNKAVAVVKDARKMSGFSIVKQGTLDELEVFVLQQSAKNPEGFRLGTMNTSSHNGQVYFFAEGFFSGNEINCVSEKDGNLVIEKVMLRTREPEPKQEEKKEELEYELEM